MVFLATGTSISGANEKPYGPCKRESQLEPRTARKRSQETTEAAAKIHGSTNEHSSVTFDGLFDTLQKRCKLDTLTKLIL